MRIESYERSFVEKVRRVRVLGICCRSMGVWIRTNDAKVFGLGLFVIERQRLGEGSNLEAKMVGGLGRVWFIKKRSV